LLDALADASVAVEEVALAIAGDAYPGLSTPRYCGMLDDMAAPIRAALASEQDLDDRIEIFTEHVYGRLGFFGNEECYYDPRNSYLNEVLERRCGIPITLAVVLMALGRRAGVLVEGIGFPGHFLVRAGGPSGAFLDPFSGGQRLERGELLKLAQRVLGDQASLSEGQLEPVDPRSIAVRMLFNLQRIYERQGDFARALVVCDRLCDVADHAFHRRDRGLHALTLGAASAAVPDLEHYLQERPNADDSARITELLRKARARMKQHSSN